MTMAKGWKEVEKKSWEVCERPDWRAVKQNYRMNAMQARARIVALGVLETLVNSVYQQAVAKAIEQQVSSK